MVDYEKPLKFEKYVEEEPTKDSLSDVTFNISSSSKDVSGEIEEKIQKALENKVGKLIQSVSDLPKVDLDNDDEGQWLDIETTDENGDICMSVTDHANKVITFVTPTHRYDSVSDYFGILPPIKERWTHLEPEETHWLKLETEMDNYSDYENFLISFADMVHNLDKSTSLQSYDIVGSEFEIEFITNNEDGFFHKYLQYYRDVIDYNNDKYTLKIAEVGMESEYTSYIKYNIIGKIITK